MVTSNRLQAAARAEVSRLIKRRDRIAGHAVAALQAEIDAIDERIALIEKAAGLALARVNLETPPVPAAVLDAILAGLRSVVDRGDANATFAAYTEGFAACLRILRDALGLDEEARDA